MCGSAEVSPKPVGRAAFPPSKEFSAVPCSSFDKETMSSSEKSALITASTQQPLVLTILLSPLRTLVRPVRFQPAEDESDLSFSRWRIQT